MYLAFQGLRAVGSVMPLPVARALGQGLGLAAYSLLWDQRRLTLAHLAHGLGATTTPAQRRRIARRVFMSLGQNMTEWLLLPRLSLRDIQRLVAVEGLEHLRQALANGNGAIALTGHFGNWEIIPLYLRGAGFEGGVLARRLRYSEYESFLISMRGAKGVPTLARGSLKDVATLLRANQIIGMLPDQDIDSLDGVFVEFFGHPAYTPVGPAALSVMTGAPIVPCFLVREGGRFRLIVEPPLPLPQTADRKQAVHELTQAWSRVVESYIRRSPDHWVWMHRRWKTQPMAAAGAQRPETPASTAAPAPQPSPIQPVLSALLVTACLLMGHLLGCGRSPSQAAGASKTEGSPSASQEPPQQQMQGFKLTGYEESGAKRWELEGQGATADGDFVTIHQPNAVGFEPERTAYLTASAALVRQTDRHIRLEHDVTIHTTDGLWLTAPILHWIPDTDEVATDTPVRLETDHMLLRGRGATGFTQLKRATLFEDIELVLNPSDHDLPGVPVGGPKQVTITCDGPLTFDYEHHVATFEHNVHVADPSGDIYSDKLVAYLNPETRTIKYAEAIGRVRIHQNQNTALSERAVYEPGAGKITLVGKPSLLVYPNENQHGPVALGFAPTSPPASLAARAVNVGEQVAAEKQGVTVSGSAGGP